MIIRLNTYFANFDNLKSVDFLEGITPGVVEVELTDPDDRKEVLQLLFHTKNPTNKFNGTVCEIISEEFTTALKENRKLFDLGEYQDRFDKNCDDE